MDEAGLGRIVSEWAVDVGAGTFMAPTLIAAWRSDSIVGYLDAMELHDDWLDRVRPDDK